MFRFAIAAVLFVCLSSSIAAQSKLGSWQAYFLSAHVNDSPWRFVFDVQYRDHTVIGDLDHIIVRPAIQYFHAPSEVSYLAGYSYILFQNEGDPNTSIIEHRFFQDIDLRQHLGRVLVRHRYRAEERFVENTPFMLRIRYALFVDIPLNKKRIVANTWFIPLWNEVFINTDPIQFDRNWLYGGVGYQITDGFGIRLGAMNQFQTISDKLQVVLSLHHNLNFKTEKRAKVEG